MFYRVMRCRCDLQYAILALLFVKKSVHVKLPFTL